jgi:hypothetical protein
MIAELSNSGVCDGLADQARPFLYTHLLHRQVEVPELVPAATKSTTAGRAVCAMCDFV